MSRSLYVSLVSLSLCLGVATGCGGGGGASSSNPPQNPAPTLSTLNPTSANAGSAALNVTATGTDFISSSVIQWNGTALATTFASSTSLSAQIPAADLGSASRASITVQNPAPGGGTSAALAFTINPPPNPLPNLISLLPNSAFEGGAAFTLTVTGTQFIPASQILWNSSPISTTYVSGTSLTAQIPASDLASAGTANLSVQSPAPGGGASNILSFTINPPATSLNILDLQGTDVIWDSSRQKIYVAVPTPAGTNPGTVTVVDPVGGSITTSQSLSSAPSGFAISDDGQYLYAVINGGASIQRLTLPALAPDISWMLGTDPSFGSQFLAGDIKVQPGSPHTLAVSLGQYGSDYVAVYDDGVERPAIAGGAGNSIGNSLVWKPDGSGLYAAYTMGNDSPYFTSVSDDALYVMPVTAGGIGAVTTYDRAFRLAGVHLHSDPTTGYMYGDWGEVINGSNGIPVGNYRLPRPASTIFPGALSVVDPALKRYYLLQEISEPGGTSRAFQIQVFDQTTFKLLSTLVIPDPVGEPTNFIRWGQAGLAFITNGKPGSGKLYLLDGGFVNPSAPQDTTAGTQINLAPTLTAISPLTATVGSAALDLTVSGRDFVPQSAVYWNGAALKTTMMSRTELSVQIPASDLAAAGQATLTASNDGSSFGSYNAFTFAVDPAPAANNLLAVYSAGGNDLVWDANAARIYVSMPGVQGESGDSIATVDPVAGTVTNSGFVGSDPGKMALSSDGKTLNVALYGANAIAQLAVPSMTVANQWNVGGVGTFDGPYYALDLQPAPGAPATMAAVTAAFDLSPSPKNVQVYDGATPRGTGLQVLQYPYSSLQWAGNDSTIYAADQEQPQDLFVLGVSPAGATLSQHFDRIVDPYSERIHFDAGTGLVYTDGGQVFEPSTGTLVGSFGSSGMAVADSTLGRVFILGQTSAQTGTPNFTVQAFDQTKFTAIGSFTISNVVGTPTEFIRWGTNGLAFTTRVAQPWDFYGNGPGQLYVIGGAFVKTAAVSGQATAPAALLPVHRTWGLERAPRPETGIVVHRKDRF